MEGRGQCEESALVLSQSAHVPLARSSHFISPEERRVEGLINVVLAEWSPLSSSPHNGKREQYFGRHIAVFATKKF